MAIIKRSTICRSLQMLERVWRKGTPPTLLVEMSVGTTTMENSLAVPQKIKDRVVT